jgi:hypothetical protein
MKYKVLKEYPPYNIGDIIEKSNIISKEILEQFPKFFAPYMFTTKDNVDIFKGDKYWFANSSFSVIVDNIANSWVNGTVLDNTYFSSKEVAQNYLNSKKGSDLDIDKICSNCKHSKEEINPYCEACSLFNNDYRDNLFEVKSFMIGAWYKGIDDDNNVAYICYQENESKCYGFNWKGEWTNDFGLSYGISNQTWELASMNKIEELLIEKAEKDYPVETKFIPVYCNNYVYKMQDKFRYYANALHANVCDTIFVDGKWAEIVEESKKWKVGTYVVDKYAKEIGIITKIKYGYIYTDIFEEFYIDSFFAKHHIKWFATKEEAEEFVETLNPTLMLGVYPVNLTGNNVWTTAGLVTQKEWLDFDAKLNIQKEMLYVSELKIPVGKYEAIIHPNSKLSTDNSIGCIKDITLKQIQNITNKIKNK